MCLWDSAYLNRFIFYINMKSEFIFEHVCIVFCLQALLASKVIIESLGMCGNIPFSDKRNSLCF